MSDYNNDFYRDFNSDPNTYHYTYTSATQPGGGWNDPPQPEKPKKKRSGKAKKWIGRVVLVVVVAAVALGGGYAGAILGNRGAGGNQVVINQSVGGESGIPGNTSATVADGMNGIELAEYAVPTVVAITTEKMTTGNFWYGNYVTSGAGSGVIISEDGYIITNSHVVNGATTVTVELHDGSTYPASIAGVYVNGDIAVIKIDAENLKCASFADSDSVKQGQVVYAIGNPTGHFSGSVTSGIVSALDRSITVSVETGGGSANDFYNYFGYGYSSGGTTNITLDVMQFDAAVSPGNSGGGLFNEKGELIGIVCAKSSSSQAEGLGFAIPSNRALEISTSLITTGTFKEEAGSTQGGVQTTTNKVIIGINVVTLTAEEAVQYGYNTAGVYITQVTMESALKAGLAAGDRIISIGDIIVSGNEDVTGYLADKESGETVTLTIERQGKMLTAEVVLQPNPAVQ
ncbi:MAG: trypsin-like peptidase domain-containing protein [Oscillospiraceae bacterium]|nr:trypsin-like peptidase domain-containing protein [Oscillospiraceae bacterium]